MEILESYQGNFTIEHTFNLLLCWYNIFKLCFYHFKLLIISFLSHSKLDREFGLFGKVEHFLVQIWMNAIPILVVSANICTVTGSFRQGLRRNTDQFFSKIFLCKNIFYTCSEIFKSISCSVFLNLIS